MGWKLGTKMTRVYNHLSNKQVNDAYLTAMGLKVADSSGDTRIKCHHCGLQNPYGKEFCSNCNLPMTLTAAATFQNEFAQTLEQLKPILKIMEDPAKRQKLIALSIEP
jgi:hypothetical protein